MELKHLICIGCPLGCRLTVETAGADILRVKGNTCKNGEAYARKELTNPTRILTTTVRVTGGVLPAVSVKTAGDIPKGKLMDCVGALKDITVAAPVVLGQVILENAAGTGVAVIATRQVEAAAPSFRK